jgi:hypothetical protein
MAQIKAGDAGGARSQDPAAKEAANDPSTNKEALARCEARLDPAQCRSSGPDDLLEPRRQDELVEQLTLIIPQTVHRGSTSENRGIATESRFVASAQPTYATWGNSGIEPDKGKGISFPGTYETSLMWPCNDGERQWNTMSD